MGKHDAPAPEPQRWVCSACGKTSRTRSGFDGDGAKVSDHWWDESCFLNAVLCEPGPDGGWKALDALPEPKETT